MKILQLISSLSNGGAEKFTVEFINELVKSHDVTLCSVKPVESWMIPPSYLSPNVNLIELNNGKKYSISLLFSLYKLLKKTKPDIVHVHSSILVFYLFTISVLFNKVIFIQTIHSELTPGYTRLFTYLNNFCYLNKKFINVCISRDIYKQYVKKYPKLSFQQIDNGIAPLKISPMFQSVQAEVNSYKKSTETIVFTAVGNYSDYKNFLMLAKAFISLEKMGKDVLLLIIGGGKSANQQKYSMVTHLKGGNIYQLGLKNNVVDYLYCSDAFIMSSIKEGMPLTILEALDVGLPIISTPAGGVVNIIKNGLSGLLTNGFSQDDIIDAVISFLNMNQEEKEKISEENRKLFTSHYSIQNCVQHYQNIYQS